MYKLEVACQNTQRYNIRAWDNFCKHLRGLVEHAYIPMNNLIDDELAKYHAINEYGTSFLIFESEEDATAFILKWS